VPGRKKGEAFFMNSVISDKLLPQAVTVLVPFPSKPLPPLEYMAADVKTWLSKADFAWEQSSVEEWQKLHDQYLKDGGGR
jgi:hypothetical protein